MQVKTGAALTADPRRGQAAAGLFHKISAPSHVTASGCNRAAEVLD